jgi:hypothetical protein
VEMATDNNTVSNSCSRIEVGEEATGKTIYNNIENI